MHAAHHSLKDLRLVLGDLGQEVVGGLLGMAQAMQRRDSSENETRFIPRTFGGAAISLRENLPHGLRHLCF